MLDNVRKPEKAKSISQYIGWTLLGLICLSFVFVGLTPDTGSQLQGGPNAAVVNSEVINVFKFEQALENRMRMLGTYINQLPAAQRREQESRMRAQVLNEMINTQLIYKEAVSRGFAPSKQEIREELVQLSYFQEDGRFSRQRYLSLLEANRMSPADFEEQIRQQLALQKTTRLLGSALKTPMYMANLEDKAKNTKASVEYVRFKKAELVQPRQITDADATKYLENADQLARAQTYFNAYPQQFTESAQVQASHILINSAEGEDKALAKIQEIQGEITPENFAEMAKKHSQDPGSASNGGQLGYFSSGRMVPEFEKAAFGAEVGSITEPVKTNFGYHILYITDKKKAEVRSFDEVKVGIAKQQLAELRQDEAIKEIESLLADNQSLASALKKYGLKWEKTDDVDLSSAASTISESALLAALQTSPKQSYVSQIVRDSGENYILKPAKVAVASAKNSASDRAAMSRSGVSTMEAWAGSLRKEASIQMNTALINR